MASEAWAICSDALTLRLLGERLGSMEERLLRAVAGRSRLVRRHAVELVAASEAYRAAVDAALASRPALRAIAGGRA